VKSSWAGRAQILGAVIALGGLAVIVIQVLRTATDPANSSAQFYVPAALTAAAVFLMAFGVPALLRQLNIDTSGALPWVIAAVSLLLSLVPWLAVTRGDVTLSSWIYHGLHVPQGQIRFWDLSLVMQSLDCSRFGFDVFAAHNGCLADPAIYGPGMLWLSRLPGHPLTVAHLQIIGVVMMLISAIVLLWLARFTTGIGRFVLLAAALGGPWLLLMERGNLDAVVLWVAVGTAYLTRKWAGLWTWWIGAAAIWVVGTWKYYPFALGLMLIPVLRRRHGWIVFTTFILASLGYVAATWSNFKFSSQSNINMVSLGDLVALGRTDVVARMVDAHPGQASLQPGDVLVYAVAVGALVWGIGFGWRLHTVRVQASMLAAGCSAVFLAAVLYSGFGWAYKAAFLLGCVPLLSMRHYRSRAVLFGSLSMLLCVGICSVVVWNTLLASMAGIIAAAFALGFALGQFMRPLRPGKVQTTQAPATR